MNEQRKKERKTKKKKKMGGREEGREGITYERTLPVLCCTCHSLRGLQ
jgi:hypothetical protein